MHQRVRGDVAVELHLLLWRWELAMQEQVGRVVEVPLLSQFLHIILWRHSICLNFCFAGARCTRHSPSSACLAKQVNLRLSMGNVRQTMDLSMEQVLVNQAKYCTPANTSK